MSPNNWSDLPKFLLIDLTPLIEHFQGYTGHPLLQLLTVQQIIEVAAIHSSVDDLVSTVLWQYEDVFECFDATPDTLITFATAIEAIVRSYQVYVDRITGSGYVSSFYHFKEWFTANELVLTCQ